MLKKIFGLGKKKWRQSDLELTAAADKKDLASLLGEQAGQIFQEKKMCCAEASFSVLNRHFNGGISDEQAVRIGSVFCGGIGNAGCVCGALAGAEAALGLLLGAGSAADLSQKEMRNLAKELHDQFTAKAGSACCRALIAPFKHDRSGRKQNCRYLTELATATAAGLILESLPKNR